MNTLVSPHGGSLRQLLVDANEAATLKASSADWPSWDLTPRQLCDLELLLNGGFSPLTGFMGRADHEAVCQTLRLSDGTLWPMPITLDVSTEFAARIKPGDTLALRDPEGVMLAALQVEDVFEVDRALEASCVYGTDDDSHPGVAQLAGAARAWAIGGTLRGLELPTHYDFRGLRLTPLEVRALFERRGWRQVVAFQTRNPLHRAHYELTRRAADQLQANLLIHPVVGMTKPGDLDHYTRVRCYQSLLPRYPPQMAELALLPLAMRMAGPREAVWHAIIRKNYGCSHFIVGRDHAGPGDDRSGKPFYGPYAAQDLLAQHQDEIGVAMVPFQMMVYLEDRATYVPVDEVPQGARTANISGTELRDRLARGDEIPSWFSFPQVAAELQRRHPPRHRQGFTVFFTGLSGAGKSTVANVLQVKLLQHGGRPVTLLDGDIVRRNLSSELGFSKEHRDINIRRIGFVAAEISKNGGIAICAPIAPYAGVRAEVRQMIEPVGGFTLVHVATSLEVCEQRDRKGLYAKARAGIVKEFTGISDPYEIPSDAEITIDSGVLSPEAAAQEILRWLETQGYVGPVES